MEMFGIGNSNRGQLGFSGSTASFVKIETSNVEDKILSSSNGLSFGHLFTDSRQLFSWGAHNYLGLGGNTDVLNPLQNTNNLLNNIVPISTSSWSHTVIATTSGSLIGWGINDRSQLGGGDDVWDTPTAMSKGDIGNDLVVEVSCGRVHTLFVTSQGNAYLQGFNEDGFLGTAIPVDTERETPIQIVQAAFNGKRIISVSAGSRHSHALTSENEVIAWGNTAAASLSQVPHFKDLSALNGEKIVKICDGNHQGALITNGGGFFAWGGPPMFSGPVFEPRNFNVDSLVGRTAVNIACTVGKIAILDSTATVHLMGRLVDSGDYWTSPIMLDLTFDGKLLNETYRIYNSRPGLEFVIIDAYPIPVCNDVQSIEETVCSAHGICDGDEICSCSNEYTGFDCQFPLCYSISSNSSEVCTNQRGICSSPDNCECKTGYGGKECELINCFSIFSNETNVCSAHGECENPDHCVCQNGYGGDQCELFSCFGFLSTNSSVCSGNGTCSGPNNCDCDDGYFGENCSIRKCFGIFSNQATVCSGHGSCLVPEKCTCETGWYGDICNLTQCFGIENSNSSVCLGRGECLGPDECKCSDNFSGNRCQSCSKLYFGENCQQPICHGVYSNSSMVCSGHGECIEPNTCSCDFGFGPPFCNQTAFCDGIHSVNPNTCSGNGKCTANDECDCDANASGDNCEIFTCNSITPDAENVCNGNGYCIGPDKCLCKPGFGGTFCQTFTCFGVSSVSTEVCSGRGTCPELDTCQCSANYFGPNCGLTTCNGIFSTDSSVCNGKGSCISRDQCDCKEGYFGDDCTIPQCFGRNASDPSVCSNHGSCVDVNNCECSEGFSGESCNIQVCTGNPDDICLQHGSCSNGVGGRCTCSSDNVNGFWAGTDCQRCQEGYYGANCLTRCDDTNCNNICDDTGSCQTGIVGPFTLLPSGNGISGLFRIKPQPSHSLPDGCKRLISPESLIMIGELSRCFWIGDDLHIIFGSNSTLETGGVIELNKSPYQDTPTYIEITISVKELGKGRSFIKSPSKISRCESLVLDGCQSSSNDRTSLRYIWRLEDTDATNRNAITSFLNTKRTSCLIEISNALLLQGSGSTFTFSLQVSSSFSRLSERYLALVQRGKDVEGPVAFIEGPKYRKHFYQNDLFLSGHSSSECYTGDVVYEWTLFKGPRLSNLNFGNRRLFIPSGTFPPIETTFVFKFSVRNSDNTFASFQYVYVHTLVKPLVARIQGGDRVIPTTETFSLSGLPSLDLDVNPETGEVAPGKETFVWSCLNQGSKQPCTGLGNLNSRDITINAGSLPVGSYRFQLSVVKGNRIHYDSVTIQIVLNSVPLISIFPLVEKHIFPINRMMQLYGAPGQNENFVWSSDDFVLSEQRNSTLSLPPNQLQQGLSYLFKFSSGNGASASQVQTAVNPPPGLFLISPSSGTVGETEFTFSLLNWENNEQLEFSLYYSDGNTEQLKPLGSPSSSFVHVYKIPRTAESGKITVSVNIFDITTNSTTTLSREITVASAENPSEINGERIATLFSKGQFSKGFNEIFSLLESQHQTKLPENGCLNDCSDTGTCERFFCKCADQKFGDDCSLSSDKWEEKKKLKTEIMDTLKEIKNTRFDSVAMVISKAQVIDSLSDRPFELSSKTLSEVSTYFASLMRNLDGIYDYDKLISMYQTVSNLAIGLQNSESANKEEENVVQEDETEAQDDEGEAVQARRVENPNFRDTTNRFLFDSIREITQRLLVIQQKGIPRRVRTKNIAAYIIRDDSSNLYGKRISFQSSSEKEVEFTIPNMEEESSLITFQYIISPVAPQPSMSANSTYKSIKVASQVSSIYMGKVSDLSFPNQISDLHLDRTITIDIMGDYSNVYLKRERGILRCSYYDSNASKWFDNGCETNIRSETEATCVCPRIGGYDYAVIEFISTDPFTMPLYAQFLIGFGAVFLCLLVLCLVFLCACICSLVCLYRWKRNRRIQPYRLKVLHSLHEMGEIIAHEYGKQLYEAKGGYDQTESDLSSTISTLSVDSRKSEDIGHYFSVSKVAKFDEETELQDFSSINETKDDGLTTNDNFSELNLNSTNDDLY